jgi:hypothetical protein
LFTALPVVSTIRHAFAFAHGGKDGHPHPVPLKTYDESLNFLRKSLDAAKLGHTDKVDGFKRLDRFVRMVETKLKPEADLEALIRHENAISPSLMDARIAMSGGVWRTRGRANCSNLNTPFDFPASFAIFFSTPTHKLPRP